MRSLGPWISAAAIVVVAAPAQAQDVSLQTQVQARQVEVGQAFVVQLTATVAQGSGTPQNPRLQVPPGVSLRGPDISPYQGFTMGFGQAPQVQIGVVASWAVTASRPGRLTIGPASIQMGGKRVSDRAIVVQVVPQGQTPQQRPFDPFDPFGNFGNFPFPRLGIDPDTQSQEPELPPVPPEYAVSKAPDPVAFVRVTAEPLHVVVGQQVHLRGYAYGSRGPFKPSTLTDPSRDDFVSYPMMGAQAEMLRVPVEGTVFYTAKLFEFALFPIHTGTFALGHMKMTFANDGYLIGGRYDSRPRESVAPQVVVTEPPLAGRPPGYRVGDVGTYQLTAEVSPREVVAGGAVSVVARLEGTGYVPQKLKVPERRDVDWSDPTLNEQIAVTGGRVGGWRRFTYIVHLQNPGTVDLGELRLPYWDPDQRAYSVASATLGSIVVTPNPDAKKDEPAERESPLARLMSTRHRLGNPAAISEHWSDRRWFWALLAFAPLSVLTLDGGKRAGRRVRRWIRARAEAKDAVATRMIGQAAEAAARGDTASAAGAVERAVYLAIESATGLRARAVLRHDLCGELMRQGVPESVASALVELLDECDGARFVNTSSGRSPADALVARAEELVKQLTRGKPRKKAA